MIYFWFAISMLLILYFLQKKGKIDQIYFIAFNSIVCIIYVIWRCTTIPMHGRISVLLGILLLCAEFMGIFQFFHMQFLFSKKYCVEKKTLDVYDGHLPMVDIFICTYNELPTLLEKTILGAQNLRYPKECYQIYVCDDGKRDEVKKLCQLCGVNYITRETTQGAKAGNINHALLQTKGELFAVLDADMICTPSFLEKTIGYFIEENVAFVQTPQVYYNKDMYQRNLKRKKIPNEQDFFMRHIQAGRAAINAVLHIGTNVIFRRSFVMKVGMYPTHSITEDMALGMRLQSSGYQTMFINEALVYGLSATNYTDLVRQRERWCRGNLQVIRNAKPFWDSGLHLFQKIAYLDGILYWFTCFQKMIYILCPLIFLFTGIQAVSADLRTICTIFIPYFWGTILTFHAVAPDTRSVKWAHIYEIAMAPHTCISILKELFRIPVLFHVTPKEHAATERYFQWRVIRSHIGLAVLTIFSWLLATIHVWNQTLDAEPYLINMFWSIYNFLGIGVCIRVAYHQPEVEEGIETLIDENKQGMSGSYASLSLQEKRRVLLLFMEQLQPIYPVSVQQQYKELP